MLQSCTPVNDAATQADYNNMYGRCRSNQIDPCAKINSDINTSLCRSRDVKHAPQFTEVRPIGDGIGAVRGNPNKQGGGERSLQASSTRLTG